MRGSGQVKTSGCILCIAGPGAVVRARLWAASTRPHCWGQTELSRAGSPGQAGNWEEPRQTTQSRHGEKYSRKYFDKEIFQTVFDVFLPLINISDVLCI